MRTIVLTLLLCASVAANGGAQTPPAAPAQNPATGNGLADGLLPEPRAISWATGFAGRWIGDSDADSKDGFYPEMSGLVPYGAGVRLHTGRSTLGRLDVGHSREGWRVWFGFNDLFRLSRRSEREQIAPFVP